MSAALYGRPSSSTSLTPRCHGVVWMPSSFGPSEASGVAAAVIAAAPASPPAPASSARRETPSPPASIDLNHLVGFLLDQQRAALLDGGLLRDDEFPRHDRRGGRQQERQADRQAEELRIAAEHDIDHA